MKAVRSPVQHTIDKSASAWFRDSILFEACTFRPGHHHVRFLHASGKGQSRSNGSNVSVHHEKLS